MRINVNARPLSKSESVVKTGDNEYEVCVKEPPIAGRANQAIIKALSGHFRVPPASIRIIVGHASRRKVIEIIG